MSRSLPTASEFLSSSYDQEIENGFFGRIVLANGSFKTTTARRLDDLNAIVLPYLRAMVSRPLLIKDVASSSGVSTQEWHDALIASGVQGRIIGTDITTDGLHLPGRILDILLDSKLNIIHLGLLSYAVHPRILKAIRKMGGSKVVRLVLRMGLRPAPVRLVSKAVQSVDILDEDIESAEYAPSELFDVIRAANILNLGYFGEERLTQLVSKILRGLRPGGLFIVCRTHEDGSNHATVFRHTAPGLVVLERLGSGSELERVIS